MWQLVWVPRDSTTMFVTTSLTKAASSEVEMYVQVVLKGKCGKLLGALHPSRIGRQISDLGTLVINAVREHADLVTIVREISFSRVLPTSMCWSLDRENRGHIPRKRQTEDSGQSRDHGRLE